MHKHYYSAGSVREDVVRRYCQCGVVHVQKGTTITKGTTDDVVFYKTLAERYLHESDR